MSVLVMIYSDFRAALRAILRTIIDVLRRLGHVLLSQQFPKPSRSFFLGWHRGVVQYRFNFSHTYFERKGFDEPCETVGVRLWCGAANGLTQELFRVPWGATQANEYLLKLDQLKYPTFPTRVTAVQTNVGLIPYVNQFSSLTLNVYSGCCRTYASLQ